MQPSLPAPPSKSSFWIGPGRTCTLRLPAARACIVVSERCAWYSVRDTCAADLDAQKPSPEIEAPSRPGPLTILSAFARDSASAGGVGADGGCAAGCGRLRASRGPARGDGVEQGARRAACGDGGRAKRNASHPIERRDVASRVARRREAMLPRPGCCCTRGLADPWFRAFRRSRFALPAFGALRPRRPGSPLETDH